MEIAILVMSFCSSVFAGEVLPSLFSIPQLPSVRAFDSPAPPNATENVATLMPDMVKSWIDESMPSPKNLPSLKNLPVPPKMVLATFQDVPLYIWPVRGKISSAYGPRGLGQRMHNGIDIPVPQGTPIQAAAAGTVLEARAYNGYGQTVILDHGNGVKTLYAHCSILLVKNGEQVERGQVIAYAGDTGRATTSHVHFGVMVKGSFQDPLAFLRNAPQQFVRKTQTEGILE
jgi:murein DD-endopeptidase MepM/ murein hydrolase activator NlpD